MDNVAAGPVNQEENATGIVQKVKIRLNKCSPGHLRLHYKKRKNTLGCHLSKIFYRDLFLVPRCQELEEVQVVIKNYFTHAE
jgi:hypothetical protein